MKAQEITKRVLDDPRGFIAECEDIYAAKIRAVAAKIRESAATRPIVLLSGPSGSGKTTTSQLTELLLDSMGAETHVLSMDNYFLPFDEEQFRLFRENKLDLESPERVDTDFLRRQLLELHDGREIELPRFDFPTHTRQSSGKVLRLKKGEIIILEGIHSLNPDVIDAENFTTRVYVSVRTRLELPGGVVLHPSVVRLARRMIRDFRTRGRAFIDTMAMFDSVERGEQLYIMPYKHRADIEIDTFFPSELPVFKNVLPSPFPAALSHPAVRALAEALDALPSLDPALIPNTSLIREFIGGGVFEEDNN